MKDSYEDDVENTLRHTRYFLKIIGMWPLIYGTSSRLENIVSAASIAIFVGCFAFIFLPCGYYTFFYVKDINTKIKTFGPVCYCASIFLKYFYLGLRGSDFARCIKHIESDWMSVENSEYRDIMARNAAIAQKLTIICASLYYSSTVSYHTVMPLWSTAFKDNSTARLLIYPGYELFVDSDSSPTYEIIYSIHCVYCCVTSSVSTATCSLVALLTTHARGQMQVQMARLQSLVEVENAKGGKRNLLGATIENHVKTMMYSQSISTALQEICFTEVVATTVLVCALEYLSLLEWENGDMVAMVTYIGLICSLTFNIFIICYAGEFLLEEGSKFGDASYEIKWYELPGKKSIDLIMVMAASKNPPTLTGGKIFEISVNTFSNVLKSSVVYMNLCRAVTQW